MPGVELYRRGPAHPHSLGIFAHGLGPAHHRVQAGTALVGRSPHQKGANIQNLRVQTKTFLRDLGHDVVDTRDLGLMRASDEQIAQTEEVLHPVLASLFENVPAERIESALVTVDNHKIRIRQSI